MMNIAGKITAKNRDALGQPPATIAFIGDSVTQGCFECDYNPAVGFFGPTEPENGFAMRLGRMLHRLCPSAQINIINAGIGGDKAEGGLARFDRDVAPYHPDLVVVGYALNDAGHGPDYLPTYIASLKGIFEKSAALGAECILLTPNLMNDSVSPYLTDEVLRNTAQAFMVNNNLELYVTAARELAAAHGIPVCDVYARWRAWQAAGVNITELLANKLNHPIRELHEMTAYLLMETIFHA